MARDGDDEPAEGKRRAAERIGADLLERGADRSTWLELDIGEYGLWGWLPLTPLGDYMHALRLVGYRIDFEYDFKQTPEERVVGKVERLIELAGLDATVSAMPQKAMVDSADRGSQAAYKIVLEIALEGNSVVFRPTTWRGELEIDGIVNALNRVAGRVVLGCGREVNLPWFVFRSNDAITHYVAALYQRAAESMIEHPREVIATYQPHGFFADLALLDETAAAVELAKRLIGYCDVVDLTRGASRGLADLLLLATDQNRMWWMYDREHNSDPASAAIDTLESWARSSRGAFVVRDVIAHRAKDDGGAFILEATINETSVATDVCWGDFLPISDLQSVVNDVIAPSHEVLAINTAQSQDAFAIVATPVLRDLLHSRGVPMKVSFENDGVGNWCYTTRAAR